MKKLKKDAHKTKLPDICDIKWCRTSAIYWDDQGNALCGECLKKKGQ